MELCDLTVEVPSRETLAEELDAVHLGLGAASAMKDGRNVREWFAARNQFAIMFGERFDA